LIAAERAANLGIKVIAFTREKADISKFADVSISVPSDNTQHIQECHMISYHIIAEIVENSVLKSAV
jgi:phosphoheptose isomerase